MRPRTTGRPARILLGSSRLQLQFLAVEQVPVIRNGDGISFRLQRARPSSGVKAAAWEKRGALSHTLKKEELPVLERAPSSGSTLKRSSSSSPRTEAAP